MNLCVALVIRRSVVGIATGYGLDGPGIESRWWRDFPHLSRPALGPTQPPVQWVPGLSRGKERPGRNADPSPLLVPWSWKSRAIRLLPIWAVRPVHSLSAFTRVTFTFTPTKENSLRHCSWRQNSNAFRFLSFLDSVGTVSRYEYYVSDSQICSLSATATRKVLPLIFSFNIYS